MSLSLSQLSFALSRSRIRRRQSKVLNRRGDSEAMLQSMLVAVGPTRDRHISRCTKCVQYSLVASRGSSKVMTYLSKDFVVILTEPVVFLHVESLCRRSEHSDRCLFQSNLAKYFSTSDQQNGLEFCNPAWAE